MTEQGWQSFGQRLIGAMRLDGATYRALSWDAAALPQAIAVILLGSLASALVFLIDGKAPGLSVAVDWGSYPVTRESNVLAALAGGILDGSWGLFIWAAQAAIVWLLWNRLDRGKARPRSWRSIAVPLGFANAPLIPFALLELVPVAGPALGVAGLLWTLVATVVALRSALEFSWGRAAFYLVVSGAILIPLSLVLSRIT